MQATKWWVVVLALVGVIVGLLFLNMASGQQGPPSIFLSSIGTIAITIGVVNLISDFVIRKAIVRDLTTISEKLVTAVNIDKKLQAAAIVDFSRLGEVDWPAMLAKTKYVECLALNPIEFKANIWPNILDAALAGATEIDLVFVRDVTMDAPISDTLNNETPSTSNAFLDPFVLATDIENEWKARKTRLGNSSLVIRTIDKRPRHGYLRCTGRTVLLLDPLERQTGFSTSHALIFQSGRSSPNWLDEAAEALKAQLSGPLYSDRTSTTEQGVGT